MNRRLALPIILLAICTGCATIGHQIDPSMVSGFRIGVTTKAEVIAALGAPSTSVESGNGTSSLAYTWAHGTAFGGAQAQSYHFIFDADGILKNKISSNVDHRTSS